MVTAPDPHERISQGFLEDATVAMTCGETEHETVAIAFGIKGGIGALAGHDPIVMGLFGVIWAKIIF